MVKSDSVTGLPSGCLLSRAIVSLQIYLPAEVPSLLTTMYPGGLVSVEELFNFGAFGELLANE